jgi:beta-lactamase class D
MTGATLWTTRCAVSAVTVLFLAEVASARTTCTLIVDADTGVTLVRMGERCDQRLTPASTFKIPLSLMGFDSGILRDANRPAWAYKAGYPAWIDLWKRTTTPQTWLRDSVVWYSQVLTGRLGADRFQRYVDSMHYGNGDVAGDPGRRNGLTTAWLSSSLRISATEQVAFVRRMLRRQLPVSHAAIDRTMAIMPTASTGGWRVRGKPGTGLRRLADGSNDRDRQVGWFVGWAQCEGRTLVLARLVEDEQPEPVRAGLRARDSLLADWLALVAAHRYRAGVDPRAPAASHPAIGVDHNLRQPLACRRRRIVS